MFGASSTPNDYLGDAASFLSESGFYPAADGDKNGAYLYQVFAAYDQSAYMLIMARDHSEGTETVMMQCGTIEQVSAMLALAMEN